MWYCHDLRIWWFDNMVISQFLNERRPLDLEWNWLQTGHRRGGFLAILAVRLFGASLRNPPKQRKLRKNHIQNLSGSELCSGTLAKVFSTDAYSPMTQRQAIEIGPMADSREYPSGEFLGNDLSSTRLVWRQQPNRQFANKYMQLGLSSICGRQQDGNSNSNILSLPNMGGPLQTLGALFLCVPGSWGGGAQIVGIYDRPWHFYLYIIFILDIFIFILSLYLYHIILSYLYIIQNYSAIIYQLFVQ